MQSPQLPPFKVSTINNSSNLILPFVNRLESYKTKFKNLHWAAINDAIHERIDEFLDILIDYQDEVSETGQGVVGQFGPNDVVGVHLDYTDPLEAIKAITSETTKFHQSVNDKMEFLGVVNATEGFLTNCNRYTYLFRIALK